jgi:hypothetical protein
MFQRSPTASTGASRRRVLQLRSSVVLAAGTLKLHLDRDRVVVCGRRLDPLDFPGAVFVQHYVRREHKAVAHVVVRLYRDRRASNRCQRPMQASTMCLDARSPLHIGSADYARAEGSVRSLLGYPAEQHSSSSRRSAAKRRRAYVRAPVALIVNRRGHAPTLTPILGFERRRHVQIPLHPVSLKSDQVVALAAQFSRNASVAATSRGRANREPALSRTPHP